MKVEGRTAYKSGTMKDECASPPYAIMPLIQHIEVYRKRLGLKKKEFIIWEPATGLGEQQHIGLVNGLSAMGYRLLNHFYSNRIDFTTESFEDINKICRIITKRPISLIVTNPPFSTTMKRKFIYKCEDIFIRYGVPWALLMLGMTHQEIVIREVMKRTALHIPYGRINFGMPNKGWGTLAKPTKATFNTTWYTMGLTPSHSIYYDDFDMRDHFKALNAFKKIARRQE